MEDIPNSRRFVTDTLLLAALPAYVYLVTFVYEHSYCSNFNIPKNLITPSLTTILVAASAIGALLLSVLKYLGLSAPFFRALSDEKKAPFHPFFAVNGLLLVFLILTLYVYPFSWALLITLVVSILVVNLLYYGVPLYFAKRKKKTLREGMEEINKDEDKLDLAVLLMKRLSSREKWLILFVVCTLGASAMIGDGEARKQARFPLISTHPNTVVLRIYGDLFICAELDRSTKTIADSLIILHTANMSEFGLRSEEVGPLKLRKNLTPLSPAQSQANPNADSNVVNGRIDTVSQITK